MTSETFNTVQAVYYNSKTNAYTILGKAKGQSVTLTDSSQTLTPGTSGITASGAFSTSNATYVGAVVSHGTVEGYIIEYTNYLYGFPYTQYEYVSNGAALSWLSSLDVSTSGYDLTLCFLAGTMIATPMGEIPVESLRAGDMVTLADGGTAPITWVGKQTVASYFADPLRSFPIRIRAGALEDGIPARDLLLSPDHAVLVDGLLAHASSLVNGLTIRREETMPEFFTYYHIELAGHRLLLAENTPAESFVDNAGRQSFDNWEERQNGPAVPEMEYPRAKSARQLPATLRGRLTARAQDLCGSAAA